MLLRVFGGFLLATLSGTVTLNAQEPWEQIPYEEWGRKDVKKVLSESPWGKVFQAHINLTRRAGANELSQEFTTIVMLRSALPVRQALYRQRQLDVNYDRMSRGEKKAFGDRNRPLLECPSCKEFYSISVISRSQPPIREGKASEELSKKIHLSNEKGERRFLVGVIDAGVSEMVFLFPRRNEKGEALFTERSRKLIFESELPLRYPDLPGFLSKVEFDVTKIIRNGKVEF